MAVQSDAEFRHRQNVRRYVKALRESSIDAQRATLMRLLTEENASAKAHGWSPLSN